MSSARVEHVDVMLLQNVGMEVGRENIKIRLLLSNGYCVRMDETRFVLIRCDKCSKYQHVRKLDGRRMLHVELMSSWVQTEFCEFTPEFFLLLKFQIYHLLHTNGHIKGWIWSEMVVINVGGPLQGLSLEIRFYRYLYDQSHCVWQILYICTCTPVRNFGT